MPSPAFFEEILQRLETTRRRLSDLLETSYLADHLQMEQEREPTRVSQLKNGTQDHFVRVMLEYAGRKGMTDQQLRTAFSEYFGLKPSSAFPRVPVKRLTRNGVVTRDGVHYWKSHAPE